MKAAPSIIEFVEDKQMLGLSVSPAQRTLLKAIYGLPLDAEERDLFHLCTGRAIYPARPFPEVAVVAGARSGKDSRVAAPIVAFEAVFGGHDRQLARGERGVVVLVAQDLRATRVAFGYVKDYLTGAPLLGAQVAEVLASEITLGNGLSVSCFPCTLRSLRGFSIPVGVLDELAFYRLEGQADSDAEVQASLRRGMVGFAETRLVKISTPYFKSGVLFEDFKRGWAQDDPDLLVWRASSALMNPTLRPARLEREERLDPLRYAREYLAEFSEDVSTFLPAAWVDDAVVAGRRELPPREGLRYVAAVDPSGGGADAFTLAICHVAGEGAERKLIQDVMRSWGRSRSQAVDLEGAVRDIAACVKAYRLTAVFGDRYSAGWVLEAFKRAGLRYLLPEYRMPGETELKYLGKSEAYGEVEPVFAQGHVELLDHPQLIRELKLLESRPQAGGRTRIDHPHGAHDDHANALALAAAMAARQRGATPWASAWLPANVHRVGEPATGAAGRVRGGAPLPAARGQVGGQGGYVSRMYR